MHILPNLEVIINLLITNNYIAVPAWFRSVRGTAAWFVINFYIWVNQPEWTNRDIEEKWSIGSIFRHPISTRIVKQLIIDWIELTILWKLWLFVNKGQPILLNVIKWSSNLAESEIRYCISNVFFESSLGIIQIISPEFWNNIIEDSGFPGMVLHLENNLVNMIHALNIYVMFAHFREYDILVCFNTCIIIKWQEYSWWLI